MFEYILNPVATRIIGTLIEKEGTTPEYYPLTLNALLSGCNQKSNRWPVTNYSEEELLEGLQLLRSFRFASEITGAGMRVPKYAQRFTETLNLGRRETAILCVLMLRGPQTLGEIKDRSERLHSFADLEEVEGVLQKLIQLEMAVQLPRMPGQKEPRYSHLLSGPVQQESTMETPQMAAGQNVTAAERLTKLEEELARLREEVNELRQRLEAVL